MSASLIGRSGSSTFRLSTAQVLMSLAGSRFSSESAPGPSIMGFEDEVEQSFGRSAVFGYVLIRAASFHHIDRFIGESILGLRWN
jgi:hypothetical protein